MAVAASAAVPFKNGTRLTRFIYGATVEDENDWSAIVKRHEEATHAAGVAPIDAPMKWTVLLERGSNAVAAKLLTLIEGGEKSAACLRVG